MKLIAQTNQLDDYVKPLHEADFHDPIIQALTQQLFANTDSDIDKIKAAFHYVRDDIAHSWDIQHATITCSASEVAAQKHGICYAKTNLLTALLRSQNIPTGFCYQRLMLFDTPEKGYCIHALNAVFIRSLNKWIRLDARGNKEGVNAQFSLTTEQLAFQVNQALGEIDYETIYAVPNAQTINVLKQSPDTLTMYTQRLPQYIEGAN